MQMAVANNAQIAKLFWERPLGIIEAGASADIILVDYLAPTPITTGNLPWHVIFGMDGSHVTTTICSGQLLMKDRTLLTLDEIEIHAKAREHAQRVWQKM